MSQRLSEEDRSVLAEFVETLLVEHKAGRMALFEAREAIEEAFSEALSGNEFWAEYMREMIVSRAGRS